MREQDGKPFQPSVKRPGHNDIDRDEHWAAGITTLQFDLVPPSAVWRQAKDIQVSRWFVEGQYFKSDQTRLRTYALYTRDPCRNLTTRERQALVNTVKTMAQDQHGLFLAELSTDKIDLDVKEQP